MLKSIAYQRNGKQAVMHGKTRTISNYPHQLTLLVERLCLIADAAIAAMQAQVMGKQASIASGIFVQVLVTANISLRQTV